MPVYVPVYPVQSPYWWQQPIISGPTTITCNTITSSSANTNLTWSAA